MSEALITPTPHFVSLRIKLLVGFTVLFTLIFALVFAWFYEYASRSALHQIQVDLMNTLPAAAQGVDPDSFKVLVDEVEPRADGYTYDLRYWAHVGWLSEIHEIEPRAWVYTYVAGEKPDEIMFIGHNGAMLMPPEGPRFHETLGGETKTLQVLRDGVQQSDFEPYDDKWGSWISAYTPIRDKAGQIIGGLGIDFEADYVRRVQSNIRNNVAIAFIATYLPLLALVYFIARKVTGPIEKLTGAARRISEGNYEENPTLAAVRFPDEIAELTSVFGVMANKVYQREQDLRRQVADLKIEIDETKRTTQVSEIVDSDFFQDLQLRARAMRERKNRAAHGNDAAADGGEQ